MTIMLIVGLTILALVLFKDNQSLRTKNTDLANRYGQADRRAAMLYDANKKMKRLSIRVVKES